MEQHYDDTFLARWMAGKLSPEELREFEQSEAYSDFQLIKQGSEQLQPPAYDEESALQQLKKRTTKKKPAKTRRLLPSWSYAAAAAVALLVGYFLFYPQASSLSTGIGEYKTLDLPDGSAIALNADSSIKYFPDDWQEERKIILEGESQFDVTKGSSFSVNTPNGTITVLGTRFVVNSRDNYFDVQCFEGKVAVQTQKDSLTLTQGQAVRFQLGSQFSYAVSESEAAWLRGESSFREVPILEVIQSLERQFDLRISGKELLEIQNFTGRFGHDNVQTAVKTVFDAMEIKYTFEGTNRVSIQK
ncbi:MAG: FecR domain-containing protein [Bacteroidota bacterium]